MASVWGPAEKLRAKWEAFGAFGNFCGSEKRYLEREVAIDL